jgi:hypothetical protein
MSSRAGREAGWWVRYDSFQGAIMLEVKDAVSKAKEEIEGLFPDFATRDLRLEEVETPLSERRWRFTFSAAVPEESIGNGLADLLRARRMRKAVELDPDSGLLISIKAA